MFEQVAHSPWLIVAFAATTPAGAPSTTAHIGPPDNQPLEFQQVTSGHRAIHPLTAASVQSYVRALRDFACISGGLTRREVAETLGVSRRSLSGWVSGEIRPTEEHLRNLQALADLVRAIQQPHPRNTRLVLLKRVGGGATPLDLISTTDIGVGQSAVAEAALPAGRDLVATSPVRQRSRTPLHAEALRAFQTGRLVAPPRRPVFRPETDWTQDLAGASFFEEPRVERGRRNSP